MSKSPNKLTYEQALQRLEAIVEAIEAGEIGIEEWVAKCEEALALRNHCQRILDDAELRIRRILVDSRDQATVEDWTPPEHRRAGRDPASAEGADESGVGVEEDDADQDDGDEAV